MDSDYTSDNGWFIMCEQVSVVVFLKLNVLLGKTKTKRGRSQSSKRIRDFQWWNYTNSIKFEPWVAILAKISDNSFLDRWMCIIDQWIKSEKFTRKSLIVFWNLQGNLIGSTTHEITLDEYDSIMKVVESDQRDVATIKRPSQLTRISTWMAKFVAACLAHGGESCHHGRRRYLQFWCLHCCSRKTYQHWFWSCLEMGESKKHYDGKVFVRGVKWSLPDSGRSRR